MKKFIWLFVFILLVGFGFSQRELVAKQAYALVFASSCDTPITYRINSIDSRFNISKAAFLANTQTAAQIWNDAAGKEILTYSPKGEVAVSLVYDERQSLNSQINQLDNQLQQQDESLKPEIANYEQQSAAFEQQLDSLNKEIEEWNTKGGAPPEEYERLKNEQAKLQQQQNELETKAQSLNQSADAFNSQVAQLNQTVDNFQDVLTVKPEEGVYISDKNGKQIHVYFNTSDQELIHTLAHEMGHALGLEHTPEQTSIMYAQTNDVITPSATELTALEEICRDKSILERAQTNLSLILAQLQKLNTQQ